VLAWRFGLSAAIFAGLAALAGVRRATWREALHSAVSGVLMLAMQFGGVYWAFVHGAGAGVSALAIGCMPLLVASVSMVTGAERLSRRGWFGMGLGVAGVALVVADRLQPLDSAAAWVGLAIGLAGIGFGTVYQSVMPRTWIRGPGLPSRTPRQPWRCCPWPCMKARSCVRCRRHRSGRWLGWYWSIR
jgi:drug/metabolite transporter (DMT)-like permease